ncbi:MAG: biotin/lipoyl-binding protein [Synergistaceae bacterium]|nr:biotin/lipoyl-binding protein [Synergistaceae bacterium]
MSNKYRVIVDGTAYTVEVENLGAGSAPSIPVSAPVAAAPVATPAAPATPAPEAPAAAPAPVSENATTVNAPMPGKILSLKVNVGDSVNNGDLVLLLEAMKMENEVFATASGKVMEIRVKSGDSVNTGDVLLVIA